jgi:protein-S-isoprenylcysteine O-methyltransferase Ste14
MNILPEFELGILNTFLFMIWLLILPFLTTLIVQQPAIAKTIRTSAPMNYEKTFNFLSMAAIIIGTLLSFFIPLQTTSILFYPGLILFTLAIILHFTILTTIRNSDPEKPFTTGPYRYSRHPIYLALTLMLIAILMMSQSIIIILVLIIAGIHQILAMFAEEKYCLQKYGQYYQTYLKKTPRFLGPPKKTSQQ